jgi:hypothetical protein
MSQAERLTEQDASGFRLTYLCAGSLKVITGGKRDELADTDAGRRVQGASSDCTASEGDAGY